VRPSATNIVKAQTQSVIRNFHTEVSNEGSVIAICDKLRRPVTHRCCLQNLTSAGTTRRSSAPGIEIAGRDHQDLTEDLTISASKAIPDIKTVIDDQCSSQKTS
jgi:hypothetical protein